MEMAAKGLKRLDLWIPASHPIYDYPPYSRAKVAREWLDIGARLSAMEQELRDVRKRLGEGESAKKVEHEAGPGTSGPDNSVSIDDFI
jgi:hypothetical protein